MSDSERTPKEIEELNRRKELSGTPAKGDTPASKDVVALCCATGTTSSVAAGLYK